MRTRLILSSLLALSLGAPVVAHAQAQIVPCVMIAGASTGTCASEATLSGLLTYLETGQSTSIAGNMSSGGLVSQLGALNVQLTSIRKQAQQNLANEDVRDRALSTERAILGALEEATRPISRGDCRAIAASSGALGGGAGGGGMGANTTMATVQAVEQLAPDALTPARENEYIARLVIGDRMKRYCTDPDVKNKIPGCEAGVGTLPGANNDPTVLIRAATHPGVGNYSIEAGMTNPEYAAAIDFVRYSQPFPAPMIESASKDSPAARAYLVLQRRYNGRAMAVVYGLTTILAESIALPKSHPFVRNVWDNSTGADLKKDFREIYPGIKTPEAPSEREMMHLLVNRQFASTLTKADLSGSDARYFAQRGLELDKLNAYLTLKLNEKSEWSNIMLAHILSNEIDPVDLDKLKSEAAAAQ